MMRGASVHDATADAEVLRRSEGRYRALAAATAGIIWTTDAHGKVAEDLPAWQAFTGQTPEEIRGDGWIDAVHPDDRGHTATFWSAAKESRASCETEFRLRRRDGAYRHVVLRAAPVVGADDGLIRGWIGVLLDVTERRVCEEELTRLHTHLAEATAAIEQRERRMALIDELNATIHACNSLEEAYPLLEMTATRLFPQMNGGLALCDRAAQFKTVAQWGSSRLMAREFRRDDCWGLRDGEMHILDEPRKGAACLHFTSRPEGASLCLPLVVHGDTLGLLHLDAGTGLDMDERRLVARLGDVIKIGVADLKLRERLRLQAIRDPLTGLFNRQYLEETLPRECQLAQRRKSPLSVAMLDIDHFKEINDGYGHEAGDEVLRELGGLLRAAVRSSDIACRYGGEEFVLVMLDADLATAASRLEQIRLDIKRRQCVYRGRPLPSITVSFGVSEFPVHGRLPGELLRSADEALYAAKRAGRDRIARATCPSAKLPTPTPP
jgi:diguanylate cyclase (GGDEF)-like protein/PAS domain S-box-containing protein